MDAVAPCCSPRRRDRRAALAGVLLLAGVALLLPSCGWDGHFTVLGYTTRPNYDTKYKTVRVPIFKNKTFWAVEPVPGMEMDLTRAVIREIEAKTTYKVVQCDADTELIGTIVGFTKVPLSYNQLNEIREGETTLVVELVWKDLRTGEILSLPRRPEDRAPLPAQLPEGIASPLARGIRGPTPVPILGAPVTPVTDPMAPAAPPGSLPLLPPALGGLPPGVPPPPDPVVVIRSLGHYRPELGESLTTAMQKNYDRMAVQIISAMEKPW
jgi:hypothetical protein